MGLGEPDLHVEPLFHQVDEGCLHAGGACAGGGERGALLQPEDRLEQPADVVNHFEEIGIQMSDNRQGESLVHARSYRARAGSHEQSLGRAERRKRFKHTRISVARV